MSKRRFTTSLMMMALPVILAGQTTIVPEFLQTTDVSKVPYSYNGLLYVVNSIGSASVVGDGVIATAAHVIFDDEALAWEPAGSIFYYPQYHKTTPFSPSGKLFQPVAFTRWTSYSQRVENDDSGPGLSSLDTFNIDFAVGYLNKFVSDETVTRYPEVHVDANEEVGILRDNRDKMIVGYPTDTDHIGSGLRGLMHRTAPGNYFCLWGGLEDLESTWRDTDELWVSTYDFQGVTTYGGNSGGPIYYKDDEGLWVMAGVVVGSNGSDGMLIRGIDEEAWTLIENAMNSRETHKLKRVDNLTAVSSLSSSVLLQWTDQSIDEAGFLVFRLENGILENIATVEPDKFRYTDTSVQPGRVYQYQIQPFSESGNRRPKSNVARARTAGINTTIGEYLNQPWFNFYTGGDSNWFVDGNDRLRAGQTRSMGKSTMAMSVIGPGTLEFEWSASSEINPDYDNPGSQYEGQIYDAVHLLLDGNPVHDGDQPVFLSGEVSPVSSSLQVPPGSHTIEWVFEKDPYTSEGEDTAFLHSLDWTPGSSDPYPVYGGFAYEGTDWHGSGWFGSYSVDGFPWVGHLNFGWVYLRPGNGTSLNLYSPAAGLGDLFTSPSLFPYMYHYGMESWVYYIQGSGQFGAGIWFYDLAEGDYFKIN